VVWNRVGLFVLLMGKHALLSQDNFLRVYNRWQKTAQFGKGHLTWPPARNYKVRCYVPLTELRIIVTPAGEPNQQNSGCPPFAFLERLQEYEVLLDPWLFDDPPVSAACHIRAVFQPDLNLARQWNNAALQGIRDAKR
jgi:hypothetical protein